MQGPCGLPQILKDVHDVDHDTDRDAAPRGLGADQVKLVLGPVDQDDPRAPAGRIAGFGLAERGGDHLGRIVFHRPGQPLGLGFGPGPELAWPWRPPGGAITSCGRRGAGSAS
jgi:hypothetical protein